MTHKQIQACGQRLRAERERLKMTQDDFASAGGVKRVSQYLYEHGSRSPSLEYLLRVQLIGVDLSFVLNGSRTGPTPPPPQVITESGLYEIVDSVIRNGKNLPDSERRKLVRALYVARLLGGGSASVDTAVDEALQGA